MVSERFPHGVQPLNTIEFYGSTGKVLKTACIGLTLLIDPLINRCENLKMLSENYSDGVLSLCIIQWANAKKFVAKLPEIYGKMAKN